MNTQKINWVFTAVFVSSGILACALALVSAIQYQPHSWIMVLTVFAGVILSGFYQVPLGSSQSAPRVGVSIVILSIAAPSEMPWFLAGIWALGFTVSQLLHRRGSLYALYIAGMGIVGGYAFVYLQLWMSSLGIWPAVSLFISIAAYYSFVVCVEAIRLTLNMRSDLTFQYRKLEAKRLAYLLLVTWGAALLILLFDTSIVMLLERDDSTDRTPFIVLASALVFYILAQRNRFTNVEEQLGSVLEAAVTLPHLSGDAFQDSLIERAKTLVHSSEAHIRAEGPGRQEIGAEIHLCESETRYLVASERAGGTHYSEEDRQALESLAVAASQAALMRQQVENLERQATTDTLTGLPNYGAFQTALAEANTHRDYHHAIALLFIDLDNFKCHNDSYGHRSGDLLLQAVAQRLIEAAGGGDFVARVGGDEFVVLLSGLSTLEQAKISSERIIQAVSLPLRIEGIDSRPVLSAGLSYSSHRELDPQTLVEDADRAMLQEKRARRDAGITERSSLSIASHRSSRTNDIIARAIREDRLTLAFQPIVTVADGRVWAHEALVRYVDPELGPVSPPSLVARAKSLGLMNELTKQIITQALNAAEEFYAIDPTINCMTVNLELGQISDAELGTFIKDSAAAHPNISLCIELNESSLHSATSDLRCDAERLQAAGIVIALDDYGSDESSVRALVHFPMNILKLDKSLISDLTDVRQSELVRALQSFGDTLNFTTIVEGVETAEMVEALQALGVRSAQGYYFGRPAPALFVREQLRAARARETASLTTSAA